MSASRRVTANTATFTDPLDVVAAAARHAGFDGLEVWTHDLDAQPGGGAAVRALLAREGLALSALQVLRDVEGSGPGRRAERFQQAEAIMDQTAAVGAEVLLVCANVQPDASADPQAQRNDLRALADMAAARRLKIGFEPLAWSRWINSYETAWACVEAADHPALGLTLDCLHLFQRGTPLAFVETIAMEKILLVQLCDAAATAMPAIDLARHHRLFPGEGVWPVAELVAGLEKRGYERFYNIEVFNDRLRDSDADAIARRGYEAFQGLFARGATN